MKIRYHPKLKELARELRKKGVLSEVFLWSYLKRRQMEGVQFIRQKQIDNFIGDFLWQAKPDNRNRWYKPL